MIEFRPSGRNLHRQGWEYRLLDWTHELFRSELLVNVTRCLTVTRLSWGGKCGHDLATRWLVLKRAAAFSK
jgi:hypothetical protein